ncbi:tRNA pseudouridine(38-40) synthase TruA [Helicobacter cappadocius]|uniref:tRNA pseudouridine synthase A n=1 Tax=Helicobacter cappadocius TaxID=3063998 RepID=A0AA90Q3J5_9HELI|nr:MULTISPECIES: tRNA pseudouridine(38-40) synthase TruA [unclassified Helicobacter]MDO7253575.1 tRNA pseudouridine(38-40) synthase TruA [Helicobacter sp. faydin-H75]MDP2539503.1 tRNA pseudouridine(38-40) synthase TruA [Helicobacter sp. faydin-H76]
MKKIFAKIAYDGSAFSGFARQRQKDIMSVTERIEIALRSMGINDEIISAGRTDKGVHATGQIISFCVDEKIQISKIKSLLNYKLYPYIFVKNIYETDMSFQPRFDARYRGYRYIFCDNFSNPFISKYVSVEKYGSKELIQEALNLFVGKHCFSYFKKQGSDTKTDIREIYKATIYQHKIFSKNCNIIYLQANGFLRSQVRLMIGAALAYSRGEITLEEILLQLDCKKHSYSKPVSANGLYLVRVIY